MTPFPATSTRQSMNSSALEVSCAETAFTASLSRFP
jgi:hypothetical protein